MKKVKMGRPPKYPWRTMRAGARFFLTGSATPASAWSQVARAKKRTGRKFKIIESRAGLNLYLVERVR